MEISQDEAHVVIRPSKYLNLALLALHAFLLLKGQGVGFKINVRICI